MRVKRKKKWYSNNETESVGKVLVVMTAAQVPREECEEVPVTKEISKCAKVSMVMVMVRMRMRTKMLMRTMMMRMPRCPASPADPPPGGGAARWPPCTPSPRHTLHSAPRHPAAMYSR